MRIERGNRYLLQSSTIAMDVKTHWEKVYKTKAPDTVSWYLPHLETSLALIERTGASLSSSIIDAGGWPTTSFHADIRTSLSSIFLKPRSTSRSSEREKPPTTSNG
jgi:hypothetical protein